MSTATVGASPDLTGLRRRLAWAEESLREIKKDFAQLELGDAADRFRLLATLGMASVNLGEYRDLLQGALASSEKKQQASNERQRFGRLRLVKG